MKKEYRYRINPTAAGVKYTVEVLHNGKYVPDMCRYFNHQYRGKAPNRKIIKLSRTRAEEYIAELEASGYTLHESDAHELETLKKVFEAIKEEPK